jgi:hypothetical protein
MTIQSTSASSRDTSELSMLTDEQRALVVAALLEGKLKRNTRRMGQLKWLLFIVPLPSSIFKPYWHTFSMSEVVRALEAGFGIMG